MVDTHNPNTNGLTACFAEFVNLPNEITDDSIDLFGHGFGKNLGFRCDLNIAISPRATSSPDSVIAKAVGTSSPIVPSPRRLGLPTALLARLTTRS